MLVNLQQRTQPLVKKLQPVVEKNYVVTMMDVIARGLVSASRNDAVINQEIANFRVGQTIQMVVLPNVAHFTLQVTDAHHFKIVTLAPNQKADLTVKFKHVSLAFLIFSFQESTAQAFARDRAVADGDVADALCFVRCLNRLEVMILPKAVAKLAVKQYPEDISIKEKLKTASKIYLGVAKTFLQK